MPTSHHVAVDASPPGPSGVAGSGGDREISRNRCYCENVPKMSGSLVEAWLSETTVFLRVTVPPGER
jgi:hypothetical protein